MPAIALCTLAEADPLPFVDVKITALSISFNSKVILSLDSIFLGSFEISNMETMPKESASNAIDENIVDWDGPDDPSMPLNWETRKKYTQTVLVSAIALMV